MAVFADIKPLLAPLAFSCLLATGCGEPTSVPFRLNPLDAILTDDALGGDSRCRFTLSMSSISEVRPVEFTWEIDQVRSAIPALDDVDLRDSGSFLARYEKVWELRRPDNGFALIMNMKYTMADQRSSSGGRLITYCP